MGGWSAALAPLFIAYAGVEDGERVLDIGCGTGNLLAALQASFPRAELTGIDPSRALLGKARGRSELEAVELIEAGAETLPLPGERFDRVLSLLVLQEFPDPQAALSEMRRVVKPGGTIAGCQWDFNGMPVIAGVMASITAVDPAAGAAITAGFPHRFDDEADMIEAWNAASLRDVAAGRISVTRRFASFDELWHPLLAGTTPSTLTLAALSAQKQAAVREILHERFATDADGGVTVTAEALMVRGKR
jgi:SAM-dependent methyltransferase